MSLSVGSGASFGSPGGGGGGGGVSNVTATAPIVSTGGATPNIFLVASGQAAGDMLFFDGTSWVRVPAGAQYYKFQSNGASAPTWVAPTLYVGAGTDNWDSRRAKPSLMSLGSNTGSNNFGSDSTQAVTASTGNYSTIGGGNKNRFSGSYAFVAGENNAVLNNYATGFGLSNTIYSSGGFASGYTNTITAEAGGAIGAGNTVGGTTSFAAGQNNSIGSNAGWSNSFGSANSISANNNYSFIVGAFNSNGAPAMSGNTIVGYANTITSDAVVGGVNIVGWGNFARGGASSLIGNANTSGPNATYSAALGHSCNTYAKDSVAVGLKARSFWDSEIAVGSGGNVDGSLYSGGIVILRNTTPGSAAGEEVELFFGELKDQRLDLSKLGQVVWRARIMCTARKSANNFRATSFDVSADCVGSINTISVTEVNPFGIGDGTSWTFTVDKNPILTSCVRVRFNTGTTTAACSISARVDYSVVY